MRQTLLIAAGSALLCGAAAAQHSDPSRIQPVTVPIRDAGTLDLATGAWLGSSPEYVGKIYDNTCTWTGGAFYAIVEHCMDVYDSARIPSPSDPNAPPGAEVDNLIDGFQIGYCTGWPTGQVDIRIGFWDHLGASCLGWVSQQAIVSATSYNGATAYFDLSGLNLPGAGSAGGTLACWVVSVAVPNGFCLLSDGDGSFNGSDDEFNWSFQHENDSAIYGVSAGPLIRGEPLTAAFGACTYGKPCGTGVGGPCGTGLGISDQAWYNTDGCATGGTGCTGVPPGSCPSAVATSCYWFGGWPSNAWASFWLELTSTGPCSDPIPPTVYCTYTDPNTGTSCGFEQCPSFNGCTAMITTSDPSGQPSANANDYDVVVNTTDSGKSAVIFGGVNGQASIPFASGTLCIKPPIKRTAPQNSGGAGGCTGTLTLRINDPASTSPILNQPPGTVVGYQGWLRDPMSTSGTDVSDAIEVIFQ